MIAFYVLLMCLAVVASGQLGVWFTREESVGPAVVTNIFVAVFTLLIGWAFFCVAAGVTCIRLGVGEPTVNITTTSIGDASVLGFWIGLGYFVAFHVIIWLANLALKGFCWFIKMWARFREWQNETRESTEERFRRAAD